MWKSEEHESLLMSTSMLADSGVGQESVSPDFDSLQGRGALWARCSQGQRSDREAGWKGRKGIRRGPPCKSGLQPGEGRDTNKCLAGFTVNMGIAVQSSSFLPMSCLMYSDDTPYGQRQHFPQSLAQCTVCTIEVPPSTLRIKRSSIAT